ncbi:MAG TPA: tol-pal system protein YbgF [Thermoanaerobaculia bacterium]|nr:tol-pal system protein YbgF [Thermoanaerobaculia bacterium]
MKKTAILLALTLAGGCATSGDLQKVQQQVSELQNELANMKRTTAGKEEVQNVNVKIAQQTEQLLKSNATLVAKVDQMDERVQNTQGTIEQTNYRIDRLAQQLTQAQHDIEELKARAAAATVVPPPATSVEAGSQPAARPTPAMSEVTVPAPAATTTSTVNPMELYQTAYRDYQRGNFDLAVAGFTDFLKQNPNSDLADNAAYWIGESLFSQKKFQEAIAQFDSVITKYPQSDKVPGALLKKGYAYINLGEKAQGIVQLQYVVHEHPSSQEASLARQRLKQLGVETR